MPLRDVRLKRRVEYMLSPEVSVIVTDIRGLNYDVGAEGGPPNFYLRPGDPVMMAVGLVGLFHP